MIEKHISITSVDTFGSRLRQARARLHWTQKELAKASGLSQSAIGNYESGQRLSSRALLRLADALRVDPQWLADGTTSHTSGYQNTALPPPQLQDAAAHSAAAPWPFTQTPYEHYLQLTARDQLMLSRLVDDFIRHCRDSYRPEADPPKQPPTDT